MTDAIPPKPLLAIETSVPTARVGVFAPGGQRLAAREKAAARHSSNLLRLCDEALGEAGLRVFELGAIACGAGPGSFTGLRVGLAVAKGLALPTGVPLVLVSSLEALAIDLAAQGPAPLLLPCLDAGKGQVYARLYHRTPGGVEAAGEGWTLDPGAVCDRALAAVGSGGTSLLAGGTGIDRYLDVVRPRLGAGTRLGVAGPTAEAVAALARIRLARGERDDLESAVPIYGRPPDITKPKRPPR